MSNTSSKSLSGLLKELLVVVLGILIAFSLNSWARQLQERKIKKEYLEGLLSDLQQDLSLLNSNLDSITQLQKLAQELIVHSYRPGMPGRENVAMQGFSKLTQAPYFYPNTATYQTLINSGHLNFIDNIELRNGIVDHYKKYESLEAENYRAQVFMESVVIPYYMNYTDFKKIFAKDTEEYWSDFRFTNILYSYAGVLRAPLGRYEEAINRCEKIIELVEGNLEK